MYGVLLASCSSRREQGTFHHVQGMTQTSGQSLAYSRINTSLDPTFLLHLQGSRHGRAHRKACALL